MCPILLTACNLYPVDMTMIPPSSSQKLGVVTKWKKWSLVSASMQMVCMPSRLEWSMKIKRWLLWWRKSAFWIYGIQWLCTLIASPSRGWLKRTLLEIWIWSSARHLLLVCSVMKDIWQLHQRHHVLIITLDLETGCIPRRVWWMLSPKQITIILWIYCRII